MKFGARTHIYSRDSPPVVAIICLLRPGVAGRCLHRRPGADCGLEAPGPQPYIKHPAASKFPETALSESPLFELCRHLGREIAFFPLDSFSQRITLHADDFNRTAQVLLGLLDDI